MTSSDWKIGMRCYSGMASLLGRRVLARTGGARIGFAGASPAFHRSRSDATGVFFADQKRTAEENVFFKKEDETLVKNLLANNPQLKYDADELEAQLGPVAKDFFLGK